MKYLYLFLVFIGLAACGSDEEKLPENVVESSNGLIITLEWSTGGSSTQAQADADLDLFLLKDNGEVDSSEGSSFETVRIEDFFADGDYYVEVEYYAGSAALDYSLYVSSAGSSENKLYESSLLASDKGLVVRYLKINKAGDTYTITDL
ncbi:pre-peptidase C-terminal domain-containing protein [Fulvivirga ulvae]|uniref:pre-peptidase C-terminal domain-containing protein n=1 Tax=Fulvivirga ulvae TaxID=2904245 RepID=UPI001F21F057|nr:pre-peptidase C-terminal domain-containing protein [Fulvivirga ulvae]UII34698.1 pre-peptidase C-terminal domain-containing protein [Fulvivirga ulvae]